MLLQLICFWRSVVHFAQRAFPETSVSQPSTWHPKLFDAHNRVALQGNAGRVPCASRCFTQTECSCSGARTAVGVAVCLWGGWDGGRAADGWAGGEHVRERGGVPPRRRCQILHGTRGPPYECVPRCALCASSHHRHAAPNLDGARERVRVPGRSETCPG